MRYPFVWAFAGIEDIAGKDNEGVVGTSDVEAGDEYGGDGGGASGKLLVMLVGALEGVGGCGVFDCDSECSRCGGDGVGGVLGVSG